MLVICFDLENTLINSWNSGLPLDGKIEQIVGYLQGLHMTQIEFGIFSFAVDFEHEKERAMELAKSCLSVEINKEYVVCWKELEELCKFRTDSLEKWEIVNLFGKRGMFDKWTRQFPQHDFMLFDDDLDFRKEEIHRDGQLITLIKV